MGRFEIFKYFAGHPLAENFDILLGAYTIHVPAVTPGEYQMLGKEVLLVSSRMPR